MNGVCVRAASNALEVLIMYIPKPIDTGDIRLGEDIEQLCEQLAKNTHEVWSATRLKDGWTYGPVRDDQKLTHPCLIPYDELPESEKEYDRNTSQETLKLIIKLGYKIVKED
jgi:ryanodine receptor 2